MSWNRPRRIKTALLAQTLTQLADLLQSGVPLMRSLDVLAEQAVHPTLAEVLDDVRNQVAEGTPLDEAMLRHPHVFSELTISMVRAGSEGAFLEDALKRTADFLEKQEELRGKVVGAMTYPAILAGAGVFITVVLVVFFVPKFSDLFKSMEERGGLPIATVALLALSDMLGKYGIFVAAAHRWSGLLGAPAIEYRTGPHVYRSREAEDCRSPARFFSATPSRDFAACWARCCTTACR